MAEPKTVSRETALRLLAKEERLAQRFETAGGVAPRPGTTDVRPDVALGAFDFEAIISEKAAEHLGGTREWVFDAVDEWLGATEASRLFWLMGGGGTGKSVVSAELVRRLRTRTDVGLGAWHFCRHDDAAKSSGGGLIRSVSAMLAVAVGAPDTFREAAREASGASATEDPAALFDVLVARPLAKALAGDAARRVVIVIDALDELPRADQKVVLDLLAAKVDDLPAGARVFVTSRDEPQIKRAFDRFSPQELRVDEKRNREDVEAYLRVIARKYVTGALSMSDIEADAERAFRGLDLKGKLGPLEEAMRASLEVYRAAATSIELEPGFRDLYALPDRRPPALSQSAFAPSDFDGVYARAREAQAALVRCLGDCEWDEREADVDDAGARTVVKRATSTPDWFDGAVDPGIKGPTRAKEKLTQDYAGDASRLKDLARCTVHFADCDRRRLRTSRDRRTRARDRRVGRRPSVRTRL